MALNEVLRQMDFSQRRKMLVLSTAYATVKRIVEHLELRGLVEMVVVNVDFPVEGPGQIIDGVAAALDKHGKEIKVLSAAILMDH